MRQTIQELVERYQNSLYAVAFNVCKNQQDAEDAVQDTFLQYYNSKKEFESEQHIRAWLIRVAINKAKRIFHSGGRIKLPWKIIWRHSFLRHRSRSICLKP